MKKRIVLCADDYGQAPAISEGIINLLQKNRLSATSCMVNTVYWPEHAKWLLPFREQIDIGLHFNVTEGKALSSEYRKQHGEYFHSLGNVLTLAYLRVLSGAAIEAELHAQLDAYEQQLGGLPDHIDGHQHIHQFPVIRDAIMRVYAKRLRSKKPYIRLINNQLKVSECLRHFKKTIIHFTGSNALKTLLAKNQLPHNQSFAGIYAFGLAEQYPVFFPQFLQEIGDKGLIMCHPGLIDPNSHTVIARARYKEYQYLAGDQFVVDCEAKEVAISRLLLSL